MAITTGVLPTHELRRRLLNPDDPFSITALPDLEDIRLGSVNLSLGLTFLVAHRASVRYLDSREQENFTRLFTEVRLGNSEDLVLQPQQFALACTREYISLPADLCGLIQSRSSYGRMGLIAATATFVTAGYQGCPTLEIVNEGEAPVVIAPDERICQLIVMTTDEREEDLRASKYQCAVRPYPSLI